MLVTPSGPGGRDLLVAVAEMKQVTAHVIRWEPRGCGESDPADPCAVPTTLANMDPIRHQ